MTRFSLLRKARAPISALLLAAFAVAAFPALAASPASAQTPQGPAFECSDDLFVSTGTDLPDEGVKLYTVNQETGAFTPVSDTVYDGLNAIGFNPVDRHIYGFVNNANGEQGRLVRVAADGSFADLGVPDGLPADYLRTYVGTFLPNGNYLGVYDVDTPGGASRFWEIDVTTNTVIRSFGQHTPRSVFNDIAYNPVDGNVYGYARSEQRIVKINPANGSWVPASDTFTYPGETGANFFDARGRLWMYGGTQASTQDTLFVMNDPNGAAPVAVASDGVVTNRADGTSCPFAVSLLKTAEPAGPDDACPDPTPGQVGVVAGGRARYTYDFTNQSITGQALTGNFGDVMDQGRTFIDGTLNNPFGGTVNAYAGTDTITITGMSIPPGGGQITIEAQVPSSVPDGTILLNQAQLTGLPNGYADVLSDYPLTPEAPDPTPIEACRIADLAVDKTSAGVPVFPGDNIDYTIEVTNLGPSDAAGATLTDTIPEGTTFVEASDGATFDEATGQITWPPFDIAAGETRTFTVTIGIPEDAELEVGDVVRNVATVDHPDDPNDDNNTDDAEDPIGGTDLTVVKTDGVDVVAPGGQSTYTITVTNVGEGPARDVVVFDTIPEGSTFVEASDDGAFDEETGEVTWPEFNLAAGESRDFTVTIGIPEDAEPGSDIVNVVCVSAPGDTNPDNDCGDDTNQVEPPPDNPPDNPPIIPLAFTGDRTGLIIMLAGAAALIGFVGFNVRRRRTS